MMQDGTIARLAGVLREINADLDSDPADKADFILEGLRQAGSYDDLKHFDMLCGAIVMRDSPISAADESTILYSSSLKDGNYEMKPSYDDGERKQITCKCVHCDEDGLGHIMNAAVKSDSIAVSAQCAFCDKITEVYFVGVAKLEAAPMGELHPAEVYRNETEIELL